MPRRRVSAEQDVSLFPFLSIIACVIGVLTMMIATLALAQTDTQDVAQIEAYEKTNKQLARADQQIDLLRQQLQATNSSALTVAAQQRELEVTIEELEQLLAEIERIDRALAEQQKVQIVIPPLDPASRETLAELKALSERLQAQVQQFQSELANRENAAAAQVTVLPQGSGLNFVPRFVECTDGAVVMHHLPQPKRIRAGEITTDSDFLELLETVANAVNESIVFLIRSDGLDVYRACQRICDERRIRNGKLPVVGKGVIDLSAFATQSTSPIRTRTPARTRP